LESVTIHSGDVIDSLEFSYSDRDGQKHSIGPWGGLGGTAYMVSTPFVKKKKRSDVT
jgi:hypothetical protein